MALPVVWMLGGPGSGKGTQCNEISTKYRFTHLSSGDLLRNEVMSGSSKGQELFKTMHEGCLVPDDEVVNLIAKAIEMKTSETKGFIIDGFPATLDQAALFEEKIGSPSKIIVIEVINDLLKRRLEDRGNFDDTADAIEKRIDTFTEKTRPVIRNYSKTATQINGDRKSEEIFADICKVLDS